MTDLSIELYTLMIEIQKMIPKFDVFSCCGASLNLLRKFNEISEQGFLESLNVKILSNF